MSQYSYSLFTLFYFLISLCFVFRTNEFISAGLTIEYLFDKYLGSEHENFILYNIKKTSLTLFIHSLLPIGMYVNAKVVIIYLLRINVYFLYCVSELHRRCFESIYRFSIHLMYNYQRNFVRSARQYDKPTKNLKIRTIILKPVVSYGGV